MKKEDDWTIGRTGDAVEHFDAVGQANPRSRCCRHGWIR